jgi:hypothetical protein
VNELQAEVTEERLTNEKEVRELRRSLQESLVQCNGYEKEVQELRSSRKLIEEERDRHDQENLAITEQLRDENDALRHSCTEVTRERDGLRERCDESQRDLESKSDYLAVCATSFYPPFLLHDTRSVPIGPTTPSSPCDGCYIQFNQDVMSQMQARVDDKAKEQASQLQEIRKVEEARRKVEHELEGLKRLIDERDARITKMTEEKSKYVYLFVHLFICLFVSSLGLVFIASVFLYELIVSKDDVAHARSRNTTP